MNYIYLLAVAYFLIINLIAVFVTIADKLKAKHHKWRVKEATLLAISALGGAVAMYITMWAVHHKTRKAKFMVGIPAIFISEAIVVILIFFLADKL